MKRLLKNISIYVIIILAATVAANFMYGRSYKADPNVYKFVSLPETIQVCNFGSSHGLRGFNYEDLENDYDCFNFAMSAQYPSYDYRLFQYYRDRITKGAVVFIPVSYFCIFGIEEAERADFSSKNDRYYSILPESLIKECNHNKYLVVKYFPALASKTEDLVEALFGKIEIVDDAFWRGVATDIDLETFAAGRFNRLVGNRETFYDDTGNRIENQEEIDAIYALIRGCQERGAIPILITTPLLHEITDIIKENAGDFYDHFYSVIDRIARDTGTEYYDYAFDERFANEYSWFIDADHLNKEGARNFTNILMQEIVYAQGYLDK